MKPFNLLIARLIICLSFSLILISQPSIAFDFDQFKSKIDNFKQKAKSFNEKKKQLDLATGNVGVDEEINIGRNVISGLLGAAPLLDNRPLQHYVNKIGMWIALQSERPDLPWTFGIIDSPNINAFASPGGYVVLTAGLYQLLENESQLAAILAHEISHVIDKHHLDAIRDTSQTEILGSLAVKATDSKYRKNMQRLVNSSVQIYARGLDKKYEFAADRQGAVLAARSGYDPYALLDVLTTLSSINTSDESMTVFLNTHPSLSDRIVTLEQLMDTYMPDLNVPLDNYRLQKINQSISSSILKK